MTSKDSEAYISIELVPAQETLVDLAATEGMEYNAYGLSERCKGWDCFDRLWDKELSTRTKDQIAAPQSWHGVDEWFLTSPRSTFCS